MGILDNIMLALAGLRASKMRALLTMLGIIIGVGSVIAIVTVGNSLTLSLEDTMVEMGINSVSIVMIQYGGDAEYVPPGEEDRISDEMIEKMQERFSDKIQAVASTKRAGYGQAKDGHRYANVDIFGVNAGLLKETYQYQLLRGRDISERDVRSARYVAGVSDRLVEKMFPRGADPIGREIKVYTDESVYTFTVIFIYKFEMPAMMAAVMPAEEDISSDLIIPVGTAQKMVGGGGGFEAIQALAKPGVDMVKLTEELQEFFDELYRRNDDYWVSAYNQSEGLKQMTDLMGTVQAAISVIAAISLMVGGIGVMNIMLVSVTERTREIGTRKALGARTSAIRLQFIVESVIICLIGGLIGIVSGLVLGLVGSSLMGFTARPSVPVIILAVMFSMVIGVFFGYYPANKAAKLNPIEALRYE